MPTGKVFLNYRRDDSEGYTGRLYDHLNARFPGRIFRDISGLQPGDDFVDSLEREGVSCAALIAVIGKHWLTVMDPSGNRRLDDPNDILRREIVNALKRNVLVVPVLVGGATMPTAEELPSDIAFLARRQALPITELDYEHDVQRLFRVLENALCIPATSQQDTSGAREDERSKAELRSLLAQAKSAAAREDWPVAVQTLQAAVSLDPTNAEAAAELRKAVSQRDLASLMERGQDAFHRQQYKAALDCFRQIRVLGGNYRDVDRLIALTEQSLKPAKSGPSRFRWLAVGVVAAVIMLAIIGSIIESSKPKPANIVDGPSYSSQPAQQTTVPAQTQILTKSNPRTNQRAAAAAAAPPVQTQVDNTPTEPVSTESYPRTQQLNTPPPAVEFRPPGRWRLASAVNGSTAVLSLFGDGSFNVMGPVGPLSAGRWNYSPQTRALVLVGVNNLGAYFTSTITVQQHDSVGFRAYDTIMGPIVLSEIQ